MHPVCAVEEALLQGTCDNPSQRRRLTGVGPWRLQCRDQHVDPNGNLHRGDGRRGRRAGGLQGPYGLHTKVVYRERGGVPSQEGSPGSGTRTAGRCRRGCGHAWEYGPAGVGSEWDLGFHQIWGELPAWTRRGVVANTYRWTCPLSRTKTVGSPATWRRCWGVLTMTRTTMRIPVALLGGVPLAVRLAQRPASRRRRVAGEEGEGARDPNPQPQVVVQGRLRRVPGVSLSGAQRPPRPLLRRLLGRPRRLPLSRLLWRPPRPPLNRLLRRRRAPRRSQVLL